MKIHRSKCVRTLPVDLQHWFVLSSFTCNLTVDVSSSFVPQVVEAVLTKENQSRVTDVKVQKQTHRRTPVRRYELCLLPFI